MNKLIYLFISLILPLPLWSATYYVAPWGENTKGNGQGSEDKPFKTIKYAVDIKILQPGDTLLVKDGVYNEKVYIPTKSSPGKWIVIKSENLHGAKITVDGAEQGLFLHDAEYIEINGFEFYQPQNNSSTGVAIQSSGGHHLRVVNNHVHHFGGSGISMNKGDYILIENNIVDHNCFNRANQMSGISIWQARASNINDGSFFRIIIRGNLVYSNEIRRSNPYEKITDGHGIIIDDAKNTQNGSDAGPYPHRFLIENNVCFDNGLSGVHLFLSHNATVRNNTLFWNLKTSPTHTQGVDWRGELSNANSDNNHWYNNIAWVNQNYDGNNTSILDGASDGKYTNPNVKWENNITYNGTAGEAALKIYKPESEIDASPANNFFGINPFLVNPSINPNDADFRLASDSPAIDAGVDFGEQGIDKEGKGRVIGSWDLGAYESNGDPNLPPGDPPKNPPSITITEPVNGSEYLEGDEIQIVANALADGNHTIQKVTFFADGDEIGSATNSPYEMIWDNIVPGIYNLTAQAEDSEGLSATSRPVQVLMKKPPTRHEIPGKIESEDFVEMDGIRLEQSSEGTFNVGWFDEGDWIDYLVDVREAGDYTIQWRVASASDAGNFLLQIGEQTIANATVPNTGDWQVYQTIISTNVNLAEGEQVFRIYSSGAQYNINWFEFSLGSVDPTPDPQPDPVPDPTPDPQPDPTPDPQPDPTPDPELQPIDSVIRINSGGKEDILINNWTFYSDRYYTDNTSSFSNADIPDIGGTPFDPIYRTERASTDELAPFSYEIPVYSGNYLVVIHFAEVYWGAIGGEEGNENSRIFSMDIEGKKRISGLDLNKQVGPMNATYFEYEITVDDGLLNLDFYASLYKPKVSAIEILPSGDISESIASFISTVENPGPTTSVESPIQKLLSSVKVYPNPTQENTSVYFSSELKGELKGSLIDIRGKEIKRFTWLKKGTELSEKISLSTLTTGLYHLVITYQGQVATRKIIKLP